jgi:hypothetical protein
MGKSKIEGLTSEEELALSLKDKKDEDTIIRENEKKKNLLREKILGKGWDE